MKRAKRVVKRRANRVMDEVILGLIGLAVLALSLVALSFLAYGLS